MRLHPTRRHFTPTWQSPIFASWKVNDFKRMFPLIRRSKFTNLVQYSELGTRFAKWTPIRPTPTMRSRSFQFEILIVGSWSIQMFKISYFSNGTGQIRWIDLQNCFFGRFFLALKNATDPINRSIFSAIDPFRNTCFVTSPYWRNYLRVGALNLNDNANFRKRFQPGIRRETI